MDFDLQVLLNNATGPEREAIARAVQRANSKPAIVVTLRIEGRRRYVVAQEDEPMLEALVGLPQAELRERLENDFGRFGGQWVRRYGNVDEMYRSLSLHEVTTVRAVDRELVWKGERSTVTKEGEGR